MNNFQLNDIPHMEDLPALHGMFDPHTLTKDHLTLIEREKTNNKIVPSLEKAIELSGLSNGMTISFHHHFRGGDKVVNLVMDTLARMGFRDLVIAPSSLTDCHAPLAAHIKNGVIRRIETSGLRGKLAEAVSDGLMDEPVVFRSHGGRAFAIETKELPIDVAFLGAPSCDSYGNANGYIREHDQGIMCGAMGYAKCDAQYARKTIILTDHIAPYPNVPFAISESDVDYIVVVDEIGDPQGIMGGATRYTTNPKELLIAWNCAEVIEASGRFKDGWSFQLGSGGASLAVARYLRERMLAQKITARFALGGITGQIVEMHTEGLVKRILDVQSFDLTAARSLRDHRFHQQISASYYASPGNEGTAVNQLDVVVLSALEIDTQFNVNVLTGSDGVIRGAIGGHPDTAAGASVSIVVAPLIRGRIPTVVERVGTIVTPGRSVDILVTDHGVAVNPNRPLLREQLERQGIAVLAIEELCQKARSIVGLADPIKYTDQVVGVVAYRNNSVIDVIRQVK